MWYPRNMIKVWSVLVLVTIVYFVYLVYPPFTQSSTRAVLSFGSKDNALENFLPLGIQNMLASSGIQNMMASSGVKSMLASSGTLFNGKVIRQFPKSDIMFNQVVYQDLSWTDKPKLCSKWGVITTIFAPPSEAVRRFSYQSDWCLIIVGDLKTKQKVFISKHQKVHNNHHFTVTIFFPPSGIYVTLHKKQQYILSVTKQTKGN